MRYSRDCGSYQDVLDRGLLLTRKLLNQGCVSHHFDSFTFPPWICWPLWNICVTNDHGNAPLVVKTPRSIPHSWLITGLVTRQTRMVSPVEQELPTLPEHLRSPLDITWVRVTRSFLLYVCFVYRCLSLCTFSFCHCVVCSSSMYGLWLPLWYLQTLLAK